MLAAVFLVAVGPWTYETRQVAGWTVKVRTELLGDRRRDTDEKMKLVASQLAIVARVVPGPALKQLRRVTIYLSPEYAGTQPRGEYHPGADWLRENGRDPEMVKGVEISNLSILKQEIDRMPVFLLHELAHAYHDRVLGFDNPRIQAAYDRAKAGGKYDKVERWHGTGKPVTHERAYGMTNAQEYFAEGTEAYFARNDFYPFERKDLVKVDPDLAKLLAELWAKG